MTKVVKRNEGEQLLFFNTHTYYTNLPIHVESCGITYPNENYYMERVRQQDTLFEVFVMEYVFEGKGYIECDGRKYEVNAGDSYILGDELSHKYYADKDQPFGKIWINVRGNFISSLVKSYDCNGAVTIANVDTSEIFERIHRAYTSHISYDEANDIIAVCLTEFVILLSRHARKSADRLEDRIKERIDMGLHFDLTVASLAKHFHISEHHLIELFRNKYHMTPKQYILQKKIWAAKSLLSKDTCEIKSMAEILGFSSVYHFTSAFKRVTGETPGEYRKRMLYERKQRKKEEEL